MPRPDPHHDRGDLDAYRRYLAGMDASMRQKVALTAAHLFVEGHVADMGMGSGAGSHALAALHPALRVTGVDLDEAMIELARKTYALPNLDFALGDVAAEVFPPSSLDGIFDSSVLHHVTSFGGYDHDAAARAIAVQVRELREGGILVVRDFLDPGIGEVTLDVPADDGETDDPTRASSAALLERFAREFRSLHATPGFPLARVEGGAPPIREGWRRYRLSLRHAVEFVLRKDYRRDWDAEVREEYTYFDRARFESLFASLGLRVLSSTPLRNPWIVRHRFRGKFVLADERGEERDDPATNYVIVGERVAPGAGVRFEDAGPAAPSGYLELSHWRDASGKRRDLVRRPNVTVDVLPWYEAPRGLYVLARTAYPRPIPSVAPIAPGDRPAPQWMAEPLHASIADKPLGITVEERLGDVAGIEASRIRRLEGLASHLPSPGGILEEVRAVLVEIDDADASWPLLSGSPFSSSGRLQTIEAQQILRAAQVDALPDARLELHVRELLRRRGRPWGAWIGDRPELREGPNVTPTSLDALLEREPRRCFVRTTESAGFLSLSAHRFRELDAQARIVSEASLELVTPRRLGLASVATALLVRRGDEHFLGVDDDDLPAAQCFVGASNLLVTPAWRLPTEVRSLRAMERYVRERLAREHGIRAGELLELGGRYYPSSGTTPEVVLPLAIEVLEIDPGSRLAWAPLGELAARAGELLEGHLRIVSQRAAHMLGLVA